MPDGDQSNVPGAVSKISQSLISALPPAFLLLVLINAGFLGMVMWFLNNQMEQRTVLVQKLIDRCMDIAVDAGKASVQDHDRDAERNSGDRDRLK
jgi:hypothetical protein